MRFVASKHGRFIILLLVLGSIWGAWLVYRSYVGTGRIRNVLLISLDTCRADHLSCYGYELATTPNIDAVAAEGTLFENVISPIPQTLPAHSSMLTGTIPPYHGVHENVGGYLADESNITLAEILKEAGFVTGAAIGAVVLDSQLGIGQGFDDYYDRFENPVEGERGQERLGGETTEVALKWLEKNKDERFFFFLHYYDPHTEYDPPEPFASDFGDNLYAGEIAYTDHCIGRVLDKLKELDLYDSTLVIITADHGEMLGEHGELTHMYFIYQGAIRVPLIFKVPGQNKAVRIKSIAGLVDIVPTVCKLLDIETPKNIQGVDLFGDSKDENSSEQERHLYSESFTPTNYDGNSLLGIVNNRYKYIKTTRAELYNLVEDPDELNNLAKEEPNRARIMKHRLDEMLKQTIRKDSPDGKMEAGPDITAQIASMPYVGSGTPKTFFDDPKEDPKEDPKDLLQYHSLVELMLSSFAAKDDAKMEMYAEEMIKRRPDLATPYEKLGLAALRQKEYSKAIVNLKKVIAIDPDHGWAAQKMGAAYLGKGDYEQGIVVFGQIIRDMEEDPKSNARAVAGAYNSRATAYMSKKDYGRAVDDFNQVIKLDPKRAEAYNERGAAYVHQGNIEQGIRDFSKAIELDPKFAIALHSRGAVYARKGDFERALSDFNRSIELAPKDINSYNSRGITYSRKGEYGRAILDFGKIIELDPTFFRAYNSRGMAYVNNGKLTRAIGDFTEAIRLKGNYGEAYFNRGVTYHKNGEYDKAIADFTKVIGFGLNSAKAYYSRGVAYRSKGEQAKAVADFLKAEQLSR